MIAHRCIILSLFALLAGCAATPPYATPDTPAIALASPQQNRFAAGLAVAGDAAWWGFFDDTRLAQLIDQALAHNHDIARAQASLLAARAVFDERQLDRLPAVTGRAQWQRGVEQVTPQSRGATAATRVGLDAQWEIDLFGRLAHLSRSAQARADAARADLRQARLVIAADVARNYYEALGYQQELALTAADIASWRETVALLSTRIAAGSGLPEELQNASANLARSEAELPALQAALQRARYRLDVLQGRAPGATKLEPGGWQRAPLAGQLPLGDVNALIRQRPDVVRAERLMAASNEEVGAATADLYPRVSLGGFVGFFALRGSSVFDAGARAFEATPVATLPALRIGSARARVRATQAEAQGALAGYRQALLLAQEEVENALTRLVENQSRLASLAQSASHSGAALAIANTRFAAGAGSYQSVLENQRALHAIRRAALQSETASYVEAISLYQALGWGMAP